MFSIRPGEISEIEKFQLFDEANEGDEVIVVERDGQIVGYAQFVSGYSDARIYFMESEAKGAGRAIIEWFQAEFIEVWACNAVETAQPFYAHFGFEPAGGNGWANQVDMVWYAE